MCNIILSFFIYFVVFKRQFLVINVENIFFNIQNKVFKYCLSPSSVFVFSANYLIWPTFKQWIYFKKLAFLNRCCAHRMRNY